MTEKTPTSRIKGTKEYEGIGKVVNPGKTGVVQKPKADPKTAAARERIKELDKKATPPVLTDTPKDAPMPNLNTGTTKPKVARKPRAANVSPSAAITKQLESLAAANAKKFDKIEALKKKLDQLQQDLTMARKEAFEKGEAKGYKRGIADAANTIRDFKRR
jgi:flagellar biosynthesis/type III secretory pathway protein FliH